MRVQGMIRLVSFGLLAMLPMIMGQGITGLPPAADGSEEGFQAVPNRRMEEESLKITKADLPQLHRLMVAQDEGIIYCPIPKVSSSEWKRTFLWIKGEKNWDSHDGTLHNEELNGLELLTDRGLKETRWALETDRFTRFVVVRDPAERLVSAFLNKCVRAGYESRHVTRRGAKNCSYLDIMPELFPDTEKASLASHARFKELAEADPESTFFHFARGLHNQVESHGGDTCEGLLLARHRCYGRRCRRRYKDTFRSCVVTAPDRGPLNVEAEALADRLPAILPESGVGVDLELTGSGGKGGMIASSRKPGVTEARREEIREFLKERFGDFHKAALDVNGTTRAGDQKGVFLSERVMEVIGNVYEKDYDLLGDYI